MDFCGNPLHDVPQLLFWAFPFLGYAAVWLRGRRPRAHRHGGSCRH